MCKWSFLYLWFVMRRLQYYRAYTVRRSSMSSTSSSSMTILHSAGEGPGKDFDTVSIESSTCGLSPAALQNIREQMALSLERTKELEERVKLVPSLQAQIASLQDENRRLRAEDRLNSNYLISSAVFQANGTRKTGKSPPPPPPRRDFGVTAGVITRNVAVGHQTPLTRNASTLTQNNQQNHIQNQNNQHVDRWYAEKSKFLNGNISAPPEKSTRDVSTQTINDNRPVGVQTVEIIKNLRDAATQNVKLATTTHCVQVSPDTATVGVSDDCIDAILCPKCKICKKSIGVNTNFIITHEVVNEDTPKDEPISLALLSTPRSKSFHLGEGKLNMSRLRTVGVQYEHRNPAKCSQTEVKTASKSSQHESIQNHKGVQSDQVIPTPVTPPKVKTKSRSTDVVGLTPVTQSKSKSTDTKELTPVMKHKSCEPLRVLTLDAMTQIVSPCVKCKETKDNKEVEKVQLTPTTPTTPVEDGGKREVSRIPRLQIPTSPVSTPVESRKYRRQDTYTKITPDKVEIAEKSPTRLTAVELSAGVCCREISHLEKVKQKYQLSDSVKAPTRPPRDTETQRESTTESSSDVPKAATSIPESTLCQPSSPRKKSHPSREMQGAMKVLNDSLEKHSNLRSAHLKNANAIVEKEWFRVSSTKDADPLNVEDYLDAYEDVSSPLLEYIVNMVDASGNTAMHYAVSHGNFDVVSILLDSKVCDINRQNKAGYTSVMLVSLADMRTHTHADVVRRLFSLSDVNIRAKQHGQTALMLAVSHGRLDMVRMLLEAGADINIQDEDGSTALMCSAEHGHIEIVKLFLGQSDCDTTIKDVDGSTALQIAMEAGHRHIGVLLYAHDRSRLQPAAIAAGAKKSKSASASPKMPSSPQMTRSVNLAMSAKK
ncbi:KN motif and ankyrin repeat domain-containing protein 2 isoform X2 [Atheta coriaria]|uniref:KN motif and ankyrin repeat domain-containing protein 2 isoform X2 n=1 Tax=Dalotia coriaria TaxID=877792 RepID=UPI0031F3CE7A